MKTGDYDPTNPQPSHCTQVMWKNTLRLGCAVQNCDGIFPPEYGVRKFRVEFFNQRNLILIDDFTARQIFCVRL